ncbi:MAG TPA: membrane dipeptidase [Acetobacteraceae bacterium]|jgi:membrane dipeptidase|nr:membrane dipeptidase [Acetobacteraceae bacterium]
MQLRWSDLGTSSANAVDGREVVLAGWVAAGDTGHFLLMPEAICCGGCVPRDPSQVVEVFAAAPITRQQQALRLAGRWRVQTADGAIWRYQLHDARTLDPPGRWGIGRRGVLTGGALFCAAGTAQASEDDARRAIAATTAVDIHSHGGAISGMRWVKTDAPLREVAGPMRAGGMAAVCFAIVSDSPCHRIDADHHIHPYRDPDPGELYAYGQRNFARVHRLVREQGLALITNAAALRAARAGTASAIVAAEGADFLEGRPERVDEAYEKWQLRHLQLTHYRVNELGDIQTEVPVHGGLTDIGAAVIRRCNARGLVVDVAHGTYDLVKRAASVTTKPLALSHTSLSTNPGPRSRTISAEHAQVIAGTGGVIGVWPPTSVYRDLDAMARGMARLADLVGVDHVGLGTDMMGLTTTSVLPEYSYLPGLATALLDVGFNQQDVGKILGGNYVRVFAASLA